MIKIFIPSYNRAGSSVFTTVNLLESAGIHNYQVVVRKSQFTTYAAYISKKNLLALPGEGGLNAAREFTRSLLKKNEWSLHMDDNVRGFIMPTKKFYVNNNEVPLGKGETMITRAKWQSTLSVRVDFAQFYSMIVEDTIAKANERGAYLAGFSAHENPAFRGRKFTDVGYVCGKAMLMKNQDLPWFQSTESSGEDYALTAAHLFDNGRVIINKWGHPTRVHYQPGGCGPYEQRLPAMQNAQKELVARYGNLFGVKNANSPEKKQGELRIRFNSLEQVEKWRAEFRHEGKPYDPNYRVVKGKLVKP